MIRLLLQRKGQKKNSSQKGVKKQKAKAIPEDYDVDVPISDEESISESDENEKHPELLGDDTPIEDAEGDDRGSFQFEPVYWKVNDLPVKPNTTFFGKSGPQHTLNISTATPFEHFCLFIPLFYWFRWAKFKGRCSFKQYIKSNPIRWGLKIFCICCSLTGYLWNACIYIGRNDDEVQVKDMPHTQWPEISSNHCLLKITLCISTIGSPRFLC